MSGERSDADEKLMECRAGCAACCVAPSISTPIPGMTGGKRAGERCVQLTEDYRCRLFGKPERPAVCLSFKPSAETCGVSGREAFRKLARLERATREKINLNKENCREVICPKEI